MANKNAEMKIPKVGTLVKVRWYDAFSSSNWTGIKDCKSRCNPLVCDTYGLLFVRASGYIGVAETVSYDDDGSIDACMGYMFVPEGMIQKITRLKP